MKRYHFLVLLVLCTIGKDAFAQSEKAFLKQNVRTLAGNNFHGRGYVSKGGEKAANYIARKFSEWNVKPLAEDSSYFQHYTFPVVTFPGEVMLKVNKKELQPGADYIVDAASPSFSTEKTKVKTVNLANIRDSLEWATAKQEYRTDKYVYYLKNADSLVKRLKLRSIRSLRNELPKGAYIVPQHGKLIWTVAQDTVSAVMYFVEDTVLPKRIKRVAMTVQSKKEPAFKARNVLGYVKGTEYPDSFVVFTAHYDHLGRMGRKTLFPGAHDNASGTSVVMYLASYFAQHPPKYSVAFMLFSGEEAGLLGSEYYSKHPVFPLGQIKQVVNLDMTGDATNGITVVNGVQQEDFTARLQVINEKGGYVPEIRKREQTANSDHYHFSKNNVPAVFIYGNGTKPYYHDVFDTPKELSFVNIDGLIKLLTGYVEGL